MAGEAPLTLEHAAPCGRRRALLLVICFAALVLIVRSMLVAHAQSPTFDVEPQLRVGLRFWSGDVAGRAPNDPPFGQAITALPLWLMGCRADVPDILYAQPISVEAMMLITAAWRALLFVPALAVAFCWAGRLWGRSAGYLAAGLLLADPNFAGLIPIGTADALAAEASLITLYLFWQYLRAPALLRAIQTSAMLGIAMSIKHNAAVAALSILLTGLIWLTTEKRSIRTTALHGLAGTAIVLLTIWALTRFDISAPAPAHADVGQAGWRMPAGAYIGSFIRGMRHNEWGHPAYLLGAQSQDGWWYYFPVLATYKVPIGTALALLVALASFTWRKFRREELGLIVPIDVGLAFMMYASINTGFRHFLPVYILLLILAARALADAPRWARIVAWCALGLTTIHSVSYHPDYLVYINAARPAAYLAISDSNTDWGQGLKQVGQWLDEHPTDRPVYLRYFGRGNEGVQHYLGARVRPLSASDPIPQSGLLIISPVLVAGAYDQQYAFLRPHRPIAVIGHALLVYDMEAISKTH